MDELVIEGGNQEGLQFRLRWATDTPAGTAAEATRGALALSLRGLPIWAGEVADEGFSWTWVELLEFLAHAYPWLLWQEGLPFGLRPGRPDALRAQAEDRWEDLPAGRRRTEEALFEGFEEVHDLSRAPQGAVLPPLWVVREGRRAWLCSNPIVVERPWHEVVATLDAIAEAVVERIRPLSDERARLAVRGWDERGAVDVAEGIRIATGLAEDVLAVIRGSRSLADAWGQEGTSFEPNELVATARLSAGLPPQVVCQITDWVRKGPKSATPALDLLAGQAAAWLEGDVARQSPYDQGYALALWLRAQADMAGGHGKVAPETLLAHWGVRVVEVHLEAVEVDAFACWGPRHGPTIFLNTHGRHNTSLGGRNATLAHEIAHLLIDRLGALPLAEVLGGRTSPGVEARARAFAAEMLLPREIAGREMAAGHKEPSHAARRLQRRYGVSLEIIAWQARNSEWHLPAPVLSYLKTQVSRPSVF